MPRVGPCRTLDRPMNDRAFGELLRELRCAAGLSQEALAERARLSPGAISTLERSARRAPQQQTLALLAAALALGHEDRARLEQAAIAGRRRGPAAVSPPATSDRLANLPNVLTSFHGREAELDSLDRLIASRRLVTLLGPGGVGKTRLALEAARVQLRASCFPDGVWFVDLAPLSAAELVTTAIARLLSVREQPNAPLIDTLLAALGEKKLLLVLDNCEHVLSECARVAEAMLRACSNIVMLATTREALRIDGECIFRVSPLSYAGERGSGPALDLLVERLIDADFARFSTMSREDLTDAATICRRLDGLPLAIELAAGRARDLPLAHIVAGLDERLTLLARGRRTAMPRQQTLRGMIDWSFALLEPGEQQLFARLGLFATSFSPEAVAEICGDDDAFVRDALEDLSAKSLVVAIEQHDGRLRYRLLETTRTYAVERLRESGEHDPFAARFAQYFRTLATAADARFGRIANAEFLAFVEPDLDNFRTALEWSLGRRNDTALGAELAGALGWVYRQTLLFAEGARWAERALAEAGDVPPLVAGRLHMALSFLYFNMGSMRRALDAALHATVSYRTVAAPSELTWSLTQQVYCLHMLGDGDGARLAADEAVDVARRQDDALRLAGALNALAITIPLERAAERFAPLEEAIRYFRAAGDENALVPTANLAETHYATGNFAAALSSGLDVVAITRKDRDRSNLAAALANVAAYALTVGDVAQADAAAREALTLVRDLGKTLNTMCALQHMGTIAARRGDHVRGARLQGASNALYRAFGLTREFTEQSLYDCTIEEIRASLGDCELERHLAAGVALPVEDAVTEALSRD
jgi:predicted ATPase/DNA-binding XRE family transcriptional regulator